ncbi:MAG: hypothetical protein KDA96_14715, partial [Planctomycetaceae bacterium]|nr:hypothetical protein [Planctomycetaceae bacterium]
HRRVPAGSKTEPPSKLFDRPVLLKEIEGILPSLDHKTRQNGSRNWPRLVISTHLHRRRFTGLLKDERTTASI